MTQASTNNGSVLLLPKLKLNSDVRTGPVGQWDDHQSKSFKDIAQSLDYEGPGDLHGVSSVPTMWARPLLMEMAIHTPNHPIRKQMIDQWQGMLAAIAFAAIDGYDLKVRLLRLDDYANQAFAKALKKLLPDPRHALYNSKEIGDNNPWRETYLWLWKQKPVGMTTPSTLVVPSAEGDWSGLRWWRDGRLQAPHSDLTPNQKKQLYLWLTHVQQVVGAGTPQSNETAINTIVALLDDFKHTLLQENPAEPTASLVDDPQFFGEQLTRGPLESLNLPLKAPDRPSSVSIVSSSGKEPRKPLLIIDPTVATKWGEAPQNIYLHNGKTLASLDVNNLTHNEPGWSDVEWRRPAELFLPELTYIDNTKSAFPGAQMPEGSDALTFAGGNISPLLPIDPILTDYLSAEELCKRLTFRKIEGRDYEVEVILDLPLAGPDHTPNTNLGRPRNNGTPVQSKNLRVSHIYTLKSEHALTGVPMLEVWPNFKAPGWQEYYGYYCDAGYGQEKKTFHVKFPSVVQRYKDAFQSIHEWIRLEEFPDTLTCSNLNETTLGVILLKSPPNLEPTRSWRVGVDFGTSFTNVYVRDGSLVQCLPLNSLHLQVTDPGSNVRLPDLINYFIPSQFLPQECPMPLSSVLTTRGSQKKLSQDSESGNAITDGRMYIPNALDFDPGRPWIETDLKWTNYGANRLFLRHLILHISALAVYQGVNEIHWALSYPSAFSPNNLKGYAEAWKQIICEIQPHVGLQYHLDIGAEGSNYLQTESVAIAQYALEEGKVPLSAATCIDMGGGTSDISIWENRKLLHQCSVQLAGKHLMSQILERNPEFVAKRLTGDEDGWEKRNLRGGQFHAKLDVWLRWEGEKWLREKRASQNNTRDVQGLIQITSIGMAGLYYYVGLILKALHEEGEYSREKATSAVFFGGNGSRLLNWIDGTGKFSDQSEINRLLSRMISCGSGFDHIDVPITCSKNPKHEVAWGLVVERHDDLRGYQRDPYSDPLIPGEAFRVNGMDVDWKTRMDMVALTGNGTVDSFDIPELEELPKFLHAFHKTLLEQRIESIKPLPGYTYRPDIVDVADNPNLWRDTKESLKDILADSQLTGYYQEIREEPPFILGLKALLAHLSQQWIQHF